MPTRLMYSKVTGSEMSSCSSAQLEPLTRDLVCRTLTLPLHHLPGKGPLQAKGTPGAVCRDVLGTQLEQQQISHDRHRDRAFHTIGFSGDLMLTQSYDAFELFHQQLDPPSAKI